MNKDKKEKIYKVLLNEEDHYILKQVALLKRMTMKDTVGELARMELERILNQKED